MSASTPMATKAGHRGSRTFGAFTEEAGITYAREYHFSAHCLVKTARSFVHPLQRALLPNPDVSHDQDAEENHHLQQPEQAEQLELHRPGKQEDGLYVEDHEQDG